MRVQVPTIPPHLGSCPWPRVLPPPVRSFLASRTPEATDPWRRRAALLALEGNHGAPRCSGPVPPCWAWAAALPGRDSQDCSSPRGLSRTHQPTRPSERPSEDRSSENVGTVQARAQCQQSQLYPAAKRCSDASDRPGHVVRAGQAEPAAAPRQGLLHFPVPFPGEAPCPLVPAGRSWACLPRSGLDPAPRAQGTASRMPGTPGLGNSHEAPGVE